jgi:hypothetical protein
MDHQPTTTTTTTAREESELNPEAISLLSLERQLAFRRVSPRLAARWRAQQQLQQQEDKEEGDTEPKVVQCVEQSSLQQLQQQHDLWDNLEDVDERDSEGQPQQQQQPNGFLALATRFVIMKKTCILMYISMMTLLVSLLGYLAPLMKYFKLNVSPKLVDKLNETSELLHFVNDTFYEEGF